MSEDDLGTMSTFEAEGHSFIVRLWRVNASDDEAIAGWRGRVEHVQSGRYQYFKQLEDVPQILRAQTETFEKLEDVFEPERRKGS